MLCAVANRIIAQQVARVVTSHADDAASREHHHEAHRAHARLVDLIEVGAVAEAEALWRRHLEQGLEHLLSAPASATTVVDVMS
jgi:DNA-binding GntR family transcriptional regulator